MKKKYKERTEGVSLLPALSAEVVAADVRRHNSGLGAVAHLTANQRMAAKRLRLALGALRQQGPWRADAFP